MSIEGFSISSMKGNPSDIEIAALTSAISVWTVGLSKLNPQDNSNIGDKTVDNLDLVSGLERYMCRNTQVSALNFGLRNVNTWSLAHRVRGRK